MFVREGRLHCRGEDALSPRRVFWRVSDREERVVEVNDRWMILEWCAESCRDRKICDVGWRREGEDWKGQGWNRETKGRRRTLG